MAGLRRREIDLLEWSSFKWDKNEIQIKRTDYFEAKTEDSYGSVQVDPELMSVFRGYRPRAKGDFVIESDLEPSAVSWNRYRCQSHFRALAAWLREHGVEGDKPIHVLRKEFGSRINELGDIHAASMALRARRHRHHRRSSTPTAASASQPISAGCSTPRRQTSSQSTSLT